MRQEPRHLVQRHGAATAAPKLLQNVSWLAAGVTGSLRAAGTWSGNLFGGLTEASAG